MCALWYRRSGYVHLIKGDTEVAQGVTMPGRTCWGLFFFLNYSSGSSDRVQEEFCISFLVFPAGYAFLFSLSFSFSHSFLSVSLFAFWRYPFTKCSVLSIGLSGFLHTYARVAITQIKVWSGPGSQKRLHFCHFSQVVFPGGCMGALSVRCDSLGNQSLVILEC